MGKWEMGILPKTRSGKRGEEYLMHNHHHHSLSEGNLNRFLPLSCYPLPLPSSLHALPLPPIHKGRNRGDFCLARERTARTHNKKQQTQRQMNKHTGRRKGTLENSTSTDRQQRRTTRQREKERKQQGEADDCFLRMISSSSFD